MAPRRGETVQMVDDRRCTLLDRAPGAGCWWASLPGGHVVQVKRKVITLADLTPRWRQL